MAVGSYDKREVNIDLVIGEVMKHLNLKKEIAINTHCVKSLTSKKKRLRKLH